MQGIGKIEDKKNGSEILGRFHMKSEAVPFAQKPRQVPYFLQEPLMKWLRQGVNEDIFEKVPDDEPVTWCSPKVCRNIFRQTGAAYDQGECRLASPK